MKSSRNPLHPSTRLNKLFVNLMIGWRVKPKKKQQRPRWLRQSSYYGRKIVRLVTRPFQSKVVRFIIIVLLLGLILGTIFLLKDLPSPKKLTSQGNFAVSSQIFDRNGQLLYEIYADENRIPIQLGDLPDYVRWSTIAIEDKNFYRHWGFDLTGIMRAVKSNIQNERLEGGSTITQQLVKNALLTNERSMQRKIKELFLSILTEILYTKDEILEMYLNYISYGGTAVGIEAAARAYFDKPASQLTLAEASLLAGLPQAPSYYSPFQSDPTLSQKRQAEVLRRMVEDGYITNAQAQSAQSETLDFALNRSDIQAPHFVFYIRDLLYQEYGSETVEKGGLRVTTSLDLDLQQTAQASVSAEIEKLSRMNVNNGAAMIIKPNTGEILSMVGSTDYFNSEIEGQVNLTLAQRQPGSSIKPLVYATAFQEKTLNPGSILIDTPTCFLVAGQKPYCPKNYNGSFNGAVTVRRAIGNSLNIPAVKAIYTIGVETFMAQAEKMGITTWLDAVNYGLSLSLGGGEVRMIDMAQAFGVLANQGVKVPILPILKVEDYTGQVLFEANVENIQNDLTYLTEYQDEQTKNTLTRVMDRAPAYLVSHIMQDNQARQAVFGARSALVIPDQIVSAKTGTTNDLKDNWTIGFTPEFLVVTWVGNNDNTPMNPYLVSGITGAAPIFNHIMSFVLKDQEPTWQEKPPDVRSAQVCVHGLPPSPGDDCQPKDQELYWIAGQPSQSQLIKTEVWIDPTTGLPPPEDTQVDGLVLEEHIFYEDPTIPFYCSDCVRMTDEEGKVIYEQHQVAY
ncbi:transglycosylase domain-containing protein [Patescibacteria group bacterium]|nr:transglycosylase domain-containing protein [Patescibacteria group bacterium]